VAPPAKLVKQAMFSGARSGKREEFQTVPNTCNLSLRGTGIPNPFLRCEPDRGDSPAGHDGEGRVLDARERSREFVRYALQNLEAAFTGAARMMRSPKVFPDDRSG